MRCKEPRKVKVGYKLRPATTSGIAAVPCGVCLNCRIDQARVWRNRLLLEQLVHGSSCFVTMTYDDKNLPDPPHVKKKDLQNFLKKLRFQVDPVKIRYFAVGEYGDNSFRPHYHIAIFGLSVLSRDTIYRCWRKCDPKLGFDVGELNSGSVSYITGYITKKYKKQLNEHPINYGKRDEFALMSRKPALGSPTVEKIVEKLKNDNRIQKQWFDTFRYNGKKLPFGRFLKHKMNDWQDLDWTENLLKFFSEQQKYFDIRNKTAKTYKYDRRAIL